MKKGLLLIALVTAIIWTGSANAALYTYDFSAMGLSEGQVIEGNTYGVATLTSEGGGLYYTNDYGQGIGYNYGNGMTSDVYFDFSAAVDFVSFRAGDGAGDYDAFALSLYEFGTNNFIGTFASPVFGGPNEPEWFTLSVGAANIGRVVFDPANGGNLPGIMGYAGGVVITDFAYNTVDKVVPEPASMLLFGLGVLGAGIVRRFRK
jgi:hypothetical protein